MIRPDWGAPDDVVALVTTRSDGASEAPYDSFNLARHVGDEAARVEANRATLLAALPDRVPVQWLSQVHGTDILHVRDPSTVSSAPDLAPYPAPQADAIFLPTRGIAGAVMTADCLPVLFADTAGTAVAAAHAGWRGLVAGILENTVAQFPDTRSLVAWLGPAIGPCHFEVGAEVRDIFLARATAYGEAATEDAFRPAAHVGKWMADIYALARVRLEAAGVTSISGGHFCTVCEQRFYSYRRDGVTGRMASLIYRRPPARE
jgi:YfiH family protein